MANNLIRNVVGSSLSATPATTAVTSLVVNLQSEDPAVRTEAWQTGGVAGAAAVSPVVELFDHEDQEICRAAKRALWQIVRYSGRPGADAERSAVAGNLVALLAMDHPAWVKREVIWMLSEIGDDGCVPAVAGFMGDAELRDDARMALERIPGAASRDTLEDALAAAPKEFQPAIAVSLRKRGVPVKGHPSVSRVPTRQTEVKPL